MLGLVRFQAPAEQWRLHPTFNGDVTRLIDTPSITYILSRSEPFYGEGTDNSVPSYMLFCYDKQSEELNFLNRTNRLSAGSIACIEYNPTTDDLAVGYRDGNIDFLHSDGSKTSVPGLKLAGEEFSKSINAIQFVPGSDKAYVATGFGYIVIDCRRGEVIFTRDFGLPLNAVAPFADGILLGMSDGVYAGTEDMRDLGQFSKVGDIHNGRRILPIAGDVALVQSGESWNGTVHRISGDINSLQNGIVVNSWLSGLEPSGGGAVASGYYEIFEIAADGAVKTYHKPTSDEGARPASGWKSGEFYISRGIEGMAVLKGDGSSSLVTVKERMLPNASNVFRSTAMMMHPEYGLLVRNHGIDHNFHSHLIDTPDLLSGYKDLEWIPMSNYYRHWSGAFRQRNPNGLAIDPRNRNHVYSGSFLDGIMRVDLDDPSKSIRMGRAGDTANGQPGFAAILPDDSEWNEICHFSAPEFDAEGNLWLAHFVYEKERRGQDPLELWYWTPDDRTASMTAANVRPWNKWEIEGVPGNARCFVKPLTVGNYKNRLFIWAGFGGAPIAMIDHNGTLDNRSDDTLVQTASFTDQDGSVVELDVVRGFYEDPSGGLLWIGHSSGVFTIRPSEFMEDAGSVRRIKVARNDGTQLADYLLDGVAVNAITADKSGKKWFGTMGGGVVVTNGAGTEILKNYTTKNSSLPSDDIYAICYSPSSNSMMISTGEGLAEVFLSSTAVDESGDDSIVIYPNPVRPDFYGEVTVSGLADNALVKIVDNAGSLVRELGLAAGGEIRWNITDMRSKRVRSGVYYVLASAGPNGESWTNKGKILVIN